MAEKRTFGSALHSNDSANTPVPESEAPEKEATFGPDEELKCVFVSDGVYRYEKA